MGSRAARRPGGNDDWDYQRQEGDEEERPECGWHLELQGYAAGDFPPECPPQGQSERHAGGQSDAGDDGGLGGHEQAALPRCRPGRAARRPCGRAGARPR